MEQNPTQPPSEPTGTSTVCRTCGQSVPVVGGRIGKHTRTVVCRTSGRSAPEPWIDGGSGSGWSAPPR